MATRNEWAENAKAILKLILAKYSVVIAIVLSLILVVILCVGFVLSAVNTMAPLLNQRGDACKTQSDFNRISSQISTMPTDSPSRTKAQESLDSYRGRYTQTANGSGIQGQTQLCSSGTGGPFALPLIKTPGSNIGKINNFIGARALGTHHGMDLQASVGTPIYSISSGTVTSSTGSEFDFDCPNVWICGFPGNNIIIRQDDGYIVWYWHLTHSGNLVNVGDKVQPGQLIGLAGSTGRSTGPHLHFEVHNPQNEVVDPLLYMLNNGLNMDEAYGVSREAFTDQAGVLREYCQAHVANWSWC